MNKIIIGCSILLLLGCKNETMDQLKTVKNQVKNTSSVLGNLSELEEKAKKTEKQMEELKKLEPFTSDEFKAWMPEEIGGLQRSNFEFQSVMGSQGSLKFSDETGETTFEIDIMDGAGESGSAIVASQGMLTGLYGNFESENDNRRQEIVDRDGVKSMETFYKNDNRSEVRLLVHDRFMVDAKGNNMTTDDLYELINELNINQLN